MARIFGHTFFGHKSAIFRPIGLTTFLGTQETIFYRLVVRNGSYDTCFLFLILWATFGGKMGKATKYAPYRLGLQTRPKRWALAH